MHNRACVVGKVSRVLLISAAFVSGFGLEGQAQTFGAVEGQLTSTQGKINFPFFYGRTVGSPCDPFVDYNCEVSEGTLKAAREHDLRLSGHRWVSASRGMRSKLLPAGAMFAMSVFAICCRAL